MQLNWFGFVLLALGAAALLLGIRGTYAAAWQALAAAKSLGSTGSSNPVRPTNPHTNIANTDAFQPGAPVAG